MSSCKIITILIFLLFGCDMNLPPPSFKPPINIIEEINSEVIDAFTIRLFWNYDFNEMEVDSFKIYHTSTENNEKVQSHNFISIFSIGIEQLSIDPDSLFDYYEDMEFLEYGKWHYFYISAVQGEFESLGNDTTSNPLQIDALDSISFRNNPDDCVLNNYDEDCKRIITYPNTLLPYLDSLIFIQKISSDSKVISIDTLSKSSNITTFLGLKICSDGSEDALFIPTYCDIIPNIDYTVLHYFEQVSKNSEEIRRSDTTSFSVNFVRAPISVDNKKLTYQSCRLYFNNILEPYYHSILIYDDTNTILKTATIDTLKIINNKIILDIENIVDEPPSVYSKIFGDNSYSVSVNPIILTTLPDDLVGFRLLELEREGENSSDLFMSIYEITTNYFEDFNSGLLAGSDPQEASYAKVIDFINDLNYFYPHYIFSLPDTAVWNDICGWDYSQNNPYSFPWGDEIESHNANYLNSQYPEGSNGITGVGIHPYPNANGIYDLSGNVMEWVISEDSVVARGGAYFSSPESLACDNIFNVPVTDSTGMGFHLILEFDQ